MDTYKVQSGDALGVIAERYKKPIQDIIQANKLKSDTDIHPGQVLTIPEEGFNQPIAPAQPPAPKDQQTNIDFLHLPPKIHDFLNKAGISDKNIASVFVTLNSMGVSEDQMVAIGNKILQATGVQTAQGAEALPEKPVSPGDALKARATPPNATQPKWYGLPSGVTKEDADRWAQYFPPEDMTKEWMKEMAKYERENGPWRSFAGMKSGAPFPVPGETVVPKNKVKSPAALGVRG